MVNRCCTATVSHDIRSTTLEPTSPAAIIPYIWKAHATANITPCAIANGASFGRLSENERVLVLARGFNAQAYHCGQARAP